MNEIEMLPVEMLMHHPDNPRKDLGDLDELIASIKANGVLQNLTVVHAVRDITDDEWTQYTQLYQECHTEELRQILNSRKVVESNRYWVVIGNRRLEAAKAAGLDKLPCVISDMNHKTQVATMLEENMQRRDLTVYEQAQGFQMMMDLGFSEDQIAEQTGFSKSTVKRRLKMAELDQSVLKKVCEEGSAGSRQLSMAEFDRLAKIENLDKRNELLDKVGTKDFDWNAKCVLQEQESAKVRSEALKVLKKEKVHKINDSERYSSKYESHWNWSVNLYEWKPGDKLLPDTKAELFYALDNTKINFYTKRERAEPVRKSEAEKAEEKRIAEAWEKCKADAEQARQLRYEFVEKMTIPKNGVGKMMHHLMIAAVICDIEYCNTGENIRKLFGLTEVSYPERLKTAIEKLWAMPLNEWPKVVRCFFDADNATRYFDGYSKEMPRHKENRLLDEYYEWLNEFGYQMSEIEIQMQNGTYPYLYRKENDTNE